MSLPTSKKRTEFGPTRTKQSAEAETNINNIIKRFTKTGQLTHISESLGEYRDMSGIPDLKEAMDIVADANTTFMELPAHVRKAVGHDVANFLPFIDDPENREQCEEWGLLPKSRSVPSAQAEAVETPSESVATPDRPGNT